MQKKISPKNHTRYFQLSSAIVMTRKRKGMSQEKLAEKAHVSRSLISAIEAVGVPKNFSLTVLFDIADALEISPVELMDAQMPVPNFRP